MNMVEKQRLAGGSAFPSSIKFNRLWLIPPVILVIYLLSTFIYPSETTNGYRPNLTPHNYFATEVNQTIYDLPNPFPFCPSGGAGDPLAAKYGASNLARAVIHAGSGGRVHKVLRRAMSGLPVTISVLGGSVSACHGAGDDPIAPGCWPAKFFNWWNEVFPHPASELTNGAMRNTDSRYYAYCHSHHIPDMTDLIILDFDSTDSTEPENAEHFELLLRALLIRIDNPAVIILGHFAPQYQDVHGFGGPEVTHAALAQFYDVPHVSTKPILYHPYITTPDNVKQYFADPMLSNSAGHAILAETLASYFQAQACQVWNTATSHEQVVDPIAGGGGALGGVGIRKGDIGGNAGAGAAAGGGVAGAHAGFFGGAAMLDHRPPPFMSNTRVHNLHAFREVEPFCVSANDLINPLPPSLFSGSGWHGYHPHGSHDTHRHDGTENEHYWYSTLPMSKLKVPIRLGAGDVGIYYIREPLEEGRNSEVHCYVDDNYGGAVRISNADPSIDRPKPGLVVIDRAVARGSHNVECVLQGQEDTGVPPFKILGIFVT